MAKGKTVGNLIESCKKKLLDKKVELLNRVRDNELRLRESNQEVGGDEADQTIRTLTESEVVSTQERLRETLMEIEFALARIHNGTYGVCEETEEPIEAERLLAIPWTRLSVEGAEIREAQRKRYAR